MVTITNGRSTRCVTLGAFNSIYKDKGYHIVGAKKHKDAEVKKEIKQESLAEVSKEEKVVEEPVIEEPVAEEKEWVTELLEKPISQWSKEETAAFARENGIDTSRARKFNEAKDIIKRWLDEQNKNR